MHGVQVLARLLQGRGPIEAVLVAEVLWTLRRGILEYLLQQIAWILQDGSTLWGRDGLADVLQQRCSKSGSAPAPSEPCKVGSQSGGPPVHWHCKISSPKHFWQVHGTARA